MPTFTPAVPGQIAPAADFNDLQDAIEQLTAFDSHSTAHAITVGENHSSEDTSGGTYAVSLPSASSFGVGNIVTISKDDISAEALTITPDGSDLIDGESSIDLYGRVSVSLKSTGSNWIVWIGKEYVNAPLKPSWFGASPSASNTVNSAAFAALMSASAASGQRIDLGYGQYLLAEDLVLTKTFTIAGQGAGLTSGVHPTELRFAAGKGFVLTDLARKSKLEDFAITSLDNSSGTGVGVRCRASRAVLSNLYIDDFGSHGVFFDTAARSVTDANKVGSDAVVTLAAHGYVVGEQVVMGGFTASTWNGAKVITAVTTDTFTFAVGSIAGDATVLGTVYAGNCNKSKARDIRSITNGGDGYRVQGADSNTITLDNCDGSGNTGYGFSNYSAKLLVLGPHASTNTAGDYYDNGGSSRWLSVYSEGSGNFDIDASASHGVLEGVGVYGAPTARHFTGGSFSTNHAGAVNAGWDISGVANPVSHGNARARAIRLYDPAGTKRWQINVGATAADQFSISQATDGLTALTISEPSVSKRFTFGDGFDLTFGTTTGTKFGINSSSKQSWWGKTPIIQPASANQAAVATTAATNTTPYGYTQAQADGIITLLNEIRLQLVNVGIIKGSA